MSPWVRVNDRLWRGPRPESVTVLAGLGVEHIINLQSGVYELLHDDDYENTQTLDHGIVEHDIGCSDVYPPSEFAVNRAIDIMVQHPTFVHCKHGKDRTGFIIAAYRMQIDKWSYIRARDEMFEHGFHRIPYALWLPKLKTWEAR